MLDIFSGLLRVINISICLAVAMVTHCAICIDLAALQAGAMYPTAIVGYSIHFPALGTEPLPFPYYSSFYFLYIGCNESDRRGHVWLALLNADFVWLSEDECRVLQKCRSVAARRGAEAFIKVNLETMA